MYALAMLTGVAMVASQFACKQPRSIPSTAELRSVDRLPLSPQETMKVVQPDMVSPLSWWVRSQRTAKAAATAASELAPSKTSGAASQALP